MPRSAPARDARRAWREARDAEAVEAMRARIAELFDLHGAVEFLPPAVPVGWGDARSLRGGVVYCLICRPEPPTPYHVAVVRESVAGSRCCAVCGRRLDTIAE